MGAGVAKSQLPTSSSSWTESSSNHSNSNTPTRRSTTDEMSCEACSIRFSILKRKKPCCECGKNHCSACLIKSPATNGLRRRCQKCQLLVSGRFTRNDLSEYKAKDLRQFLTRRNVPINNCTEKADLIEVLLRFSNSSQYRLEQEQSSRHTQELQERQRIQQNQRQPQPPQQSQQSQQQSQQQPSQQQQPPQQQPPPPPPTPPQQQQQQQQQPPPHPTPTRPAEEQNHQSSADQSQEFHRATPPTASDPSPDATATPFPDPPSYQEVTGGSGDSLHERQGQEMREAEARLIVDDEEQEQTTPQQPRRRAHIDQVNALADVEELTVKQLKEILATNFVDYKGCVEKWELVERVKRLWSDARENKKKAEDIELEEQAAQSGQPTSTSNQTSTSTGESELCKICMETVIDCVLLECGHMVTCTMCGRRMAECPICRQYVVRVVRVFKS